MKTYGGVKLYLHSLLTLVLDESFTYGSFTLGVKAPVSIEEEAGVGSRTEMGVLDNRNIPCTLPKTIIEKLIFFPRSKLYSYESEECKYSKLFKLFVTKFYLFLK
jgi:hypothetical protein